MSDPTAKPLLQLCRRRAVLLRRALEAVTAATPAPATRGYQASNAMDAVDRLLGIIEHDFKARKELEDGRDSD